MKDVATDLGGQILLRALATRYLKNYTDDGVNPPYDTVGTNNTGPPTWAYTGSLIYANAPLTLTLTGRGVSKGIYGASNYPYLMCTRGCPASSLATPTINDNRIKGAFYLDAGVTYEIFTNRDGRQAETFFNVSNLLDKDPPVVAQGPGGFPYASSPTNPGLYDVLGRTFRAGVRFSM